MRGEFGDYTLTGGYFLCINPYDHASGEAIMKFQNA